jgi:hypothetical protein|tara:strand:+ start:881 stop:1057 length:177 start_codon:yes stop_codon:yes gene_type:complete
MSEEDTNISNDLPEMPSMSIEDQIYFLEVALKNPPSEEIRVKTQEKLDELLNIQQDNT